MPLVVALEVNQTWSMDFVSDAISRPGAVSRRIKCFTVADDFSHECVDITADFCIGGAYVTRLLDRAAMFRGYPKEVRTDNGPEFTNRAFLTWTQKHQITHLLIEPGSPTQNACIESFNGTFRDECLDENWFGSLEQARQTIAVWRTDYNEIRLHSSCGRIPPATFAAQHHHSVLTMLCRIDRPTQVSANLETPGLLEFKLVRETGVGHKHGTLAGENDTKKARPNGRA